MIDIFREYKEALRQQRAQDVPSIYRTKDPDEPTLTYKTEPSTPTHHGTGTHNSLATSRSDPTPLNAVLGSPKHIFDDTVSAVKRPVQKVTPSRNCNNHPPSTPSSPLLNGNSLEYNGKNGTSKFIQDYVKPMGPGIMGHDNVPLIQNVKNGSPKAITTNLGYVNGGTNGTTKNSNGLKLNRNISWNRDIPPDKLSFTMRREFDKAKEESDLIEQLRSVSFFSILRSLVHLLILYLKFRPTLHLFYS